MPEITSTAATAALRTGVVVPGPRAAADDRPGGLPGLVAPRTDLRDEYPLVRYALARIQR